MGMLDGKVALVTAAAGAGIGQAVARRFAREGAYVVVTDAHARRAQEVGEAIARDHGQKAIGRQLDVTNRSEVDRVVEETLGQYGRIDVLVNNAGTNRLSPVWKIDDDTWNLVIGVTLTGSFNCTRAVLPGMIERKSGAIVNLASVAGWVGSDEGEAHYCAAKAGVMGFTRAVAAEVAKYGIRVNAVAPGLIYNQFLERIYPKEFFTERQEATPLKRLGTPEEVASLITFLASDEASYITGEVVCISGGRVMHA